MESWKAAGKLGCPLPTVGGQLVQIRINYRAKTASEPPERPCWDPTDRELRPDQLANLSFGLLFFFKTSVKTVCQDLDLYVSELTVQRGQHFTNLIEMDRSYYVNLFR